MLKCCSVSNRDTVICFAPGNAGTYSTVAVLSKLLAVESGMAQNVAGKTCTDNRNFEDNHNPGMVCCTHFRP